MAALDKEIQRVKEEKVSKEEITRAIKQARALFAYGSENITNQGFWMGYAEMFANYEWFETYLDKLRLLQSKDVQRVANEYFKPQSRVVGTYIPLDGECMNGEQNSISCPARMIFIVKYCRMELPFLHAPNFNSPSVVITGYFDAGALI